MHLTQSNAFAFSASLGKDTSFSLIFSIFPKVNFWRLFGDTKENHSESFLSYTGIGAQHATSDIRPKMFSKGKAVEVIPIRLLFCRFCFFAYSGNSCCKAIRRKMESVFSIKKNMLLSDRARSESVPMLSIGNNRIRAASKLHCSACRRRFFYCASREFSKGCGISPS